MADRVIHTFECKKCKCKVDVMFYDIDYDDFRAADTQMGINLEREREIKNKKCEECGNVGFERIK